jgi:NADH:ubiquinone oxidoreductase subunit 5 (subunit L)/multisubunit Na+/H+ antiporter MnhA subunit
VYAVALFTACLTAFYMFRRLLFITFNGKFRGTPGSIEPCTRKPSGNGNSFNNIGNTCLLVGGFINVPSVLHGKEMLSEFLGTGSWKNANKQFDSQYRIYANGIN